VDAVVICLPPALHADAAVVALGAGKHVYLEKPIATNLDDARRVLVASRNSTAVAMIGFNFRFSPLYREARRQIQAGALGELVGVRSVFTASSRRLPAWKQTREGGGGALLDLASHHVDLVRFLTGREVDAVFAAVRSDRSEADSATLHLKLGDGLPVQSLFSLNAVDEDRLELYGRGGRLTVDRYRSLGIEITRTGPVRRTDWLLETLRPLARGASLLARLRAPTYEPSYCAALAHFAATARGARPISPNFRDGYVSLAIVEAAETSASTGRVVALPAMPDETTTGERTGSVAVDRGHPACR
jgi:predicted dehydrogenase